MSTPSLDDYADDFDRLAALPPAKREAALAALPLSETERAVLRNLLDAGFTDDKARLHSTVDRLGSAGGTSYDAAFLGNPGGGIRSNRFEARVPVAEVTPQAVAPALNQAANQVAEQVAVWVAASPAS